MIPTLNYTIEQHGPEPPNNFFSVTRIQADLDPFNQT